jgi:DNA-directed RNA polymerase specialized sigma24 family protein
MDEPKSVSQRLRECRWNRNLIDAYKDRIMRLRAAAERITPAYQDMPGSAGNQDTRASQIAAAIDLERELEKMESEYNAEVQELKPLLTHLPINMREVVRMRDIDGMTWTEIVSSMFLSERWCQRLLQRAYEQLDKKPPLSHPEAVDRPPLTRGKM